MYDYAIQTLEKELEHLRSGLKTKVGSTYSHEAAFSAVVDFQTKIYDIEDALMTLRSINEGENGDGNDT